MRLPLGKWQKYLLVLFAYLLLSILLTWPLVTKFTTHVVGSNIDEGSFIWNLWWVKYAILDLHTNPLYTDYIFYPLGVSTAYYTLTLLNGLITIPLQLVTTPIVANNLVLLFSFTLSGFGAFILTLKVLQNSLISDPSIAGHTGKPDPLSLGVVLASFVAGIVYAFPASRFIYGALGQENLTSTAWIPFFILFLVKSLGLPDNAGTEALNGAKITRSSLFNAIIAGVFLLFATLTELTYAAFLGIFVGLYLLWFLLASRNRLKNLIASIMKIAVLGVTFLIGFAPFLNEMLRENTLEGGYLTSTWGEADRFSADLLSFFVPTQLHPLLGAQSKLWSTGFTDIPIEYLGFTVILLAMVAMIFYWRRVSFWLFSSTAFTVLSLGPVLHIKGTSIFDFDGLRLSFGLPFLLLHYIPLISANRVPNRFSIMLSLTLAVLVAFGLFWVFQKLSRKTYSTIFISFLVSGLILFEHLSIPLPLANAEPPAIYKTIGQEKGDFAILQLPLGWRNSYGIQGSEKTILQSYQWLHQKRILGGNTSRNPDYKFAYFAKAPILSSIVALEEGKTLSAATIETDRKLAPQVLSFYDIHYVVVHRDYVKSEVESYLLSVLPLEKISEEGTTIGYEVVSDAAGFPESIDFGTPLSGLSRISGWAPDEVAPGNISLNWATSTKASLLLVFPEPRAYTVRLRMLPYAYTGGPAQRVTAEAGGIKLNTLELAFGWADYYLEIPPEVSRQRIVPLRLTFDYAVSPSTIEGSSDKRTLAAAVDEVEIGKKR